MQNKFKKHQKNCLIVALASMIAFSTMAASVMTGCGEVDSDTNETKVVTETKIVEGTRVVEETVYVDADGNNIDLSKTDSVNKSNANSGDASGSSDKNSSAQNSTGGSANQGNSSNAQSSSGKTDSSSKPGNASNAGTSSKPASSSKPNSSSNQGSSNTNTSKNKVCTVDGNKYRVGDVIVCTYRLDVPTKLENYEACIKYNSNCLKVTKAEMLGSAKTGSLINYKLDGKVKFNGVNIGSGYDYTNGGDFLRVTYNVIGGGTVNPKMEWVASCEYYKSQHNYINSNGTPSKDFKVTKTYAKQEAL